jgi:TRAP-type C4-dicarboxylate transport system substrate-binding protein
MKLNLRTLLLGGVAAALVAAAAPGAQAKEFKMTAGSSHPPIIPWVGVIKNYVVPQSNALLKKAGSKNSIKWTEAYAGALYNFQNTLEGVQDGLADIGWVGTLWETNKMPLHNVTYYSPFVTDSVPLLRKIQEQLEAMPVMKKQWTKYNQIYLGSQVIDGYVIVCKTPINTVADLKGKKFYAPGAVARWVEGTGAVGVDGALPLYYNGIKTGVVDGAILPGSSILAFKLQEVAPYVIDAKLGGMISGALTMNLDTWKKLPPDMKSVFRVLGKGYGDRVAQLVAANHKKHFAILAKKGAKFITLPDSELKKWVAALPNIPGEWAKRVDKTGLPASQILKAYMDAVRKGGGKPLRDWDKEL